MKQSILSVTLRDFLLLAFIALEATSFAQGWTSDWVVGQSSYTAGGNNALDGNDLRDPHAAIVVGTKLIVADRANNRVLIWNTIPTSTNTAANVVIGQTTLNKDQVGDGLPVATATASSLNGPMAVASDGTRLFIADTGFGRVLIYNTIPTTHGAVASVVIGQPGFTGLKVFAPDPRYMKSPSGVWVSNGKLIVADRDNHRVLIWNTIPTTNFVAADVVLGQPNFTTFSAGVSSTKMNLPHGVWANGRLAVADHNNNRVLIWNSIPTLSNTPADLVIGQSTFAGSTAGTSATTLRNPSGVVSDGTRLVISDTGNHRVLLYNSFPTASGAAADIAVGQTSMTASNSMPTSQSSLKTPRGSLVSGSLWIVDAGNHRLLKWNTLPVAHGATASILIGHSTFTAATANDANGDGLYSPGQSIVVNGKLIVADTFNNRVLIWNTPPTSLGQSASLVVGQPNFNTTTAGVSATQLSAPNAVASDGTRLFVSDAGNHRVLIYNTIPTTSGAAASVALGQAAMTSNTPGVGANKLDIPSGLAAHGGKLLVVDKNNHRALVWNSIPTTNGASASVVVGQTGFTNKTFATAQNRLFYPHGACVDSIGRLYVSDQNNNRILVWGSIPGTSGANAALVLGQTNFTNSVGGTSQTALSWPSGIFADIYSLSAFPFGGLLTAQNRLYVVDQGNQRVLIYNPLPMTNNAPAKWVVGQPNFTTNAPALTATGFNQPNGIMTATWAGGGANFGLAAADSSNNRLLRGPILSTTPGLPTLTGSTWLSVNVQRSYQATAVDSDGDTLRYNFNFGNGTVDVGWSNSGAPVTALRAWGTAGIYSVTVRATDPYAKTSPSSAALSVNVSASETVTAATAPGGGSPDPDGTYNISWTAITGATSYEIWESTSSTFSTFTSYTATGTSRSFTKTGNGTWYYKVRARNGSYTAEFSNTVSQQVVLGQPQGAFNNSTPTTNAEEDNVNVPITKSGTTAYRIIATHPTYSTTMDGRSPDFSGAQDSPIIWSVGTRDNSSAEFMQSGFPSSAVYYPMENPPVDTSQPVSQCPKGFGAGGAQAITFRFTPKPGYERNNAWRLKVKFAQFSGSIELTSGYAIKDSANQFLNWINVNQPRMVNSSTLEFYFSPSAPTRYWPQGADGAAIMLQVSSSTSGAFAYIDSIQLEVAPDGIFSIGSRYGEPNDFAASGYSNNDVYFADDYPDAGTDEHSTQCPDRLNDSTISNQFIRFTTMTGTESKIGGNFEVNMKSVTGTLVVRAKTWNGSTWVDQGARTFTSSFLTQIWTFPDGAFREGDDANQIWLDVQTAAEGGGSSAGAVGVYDSMAYNSRTLAGDQFTTLYDSGDVRIVGVTVDGWWQGPNAMNVSVVNGSSLSNCHYIQLYKTIPGTTQRPQVFVFYQDGNARIIPFKKTTQTLDPPFGSSVIIGPAAVSSRPFVDISALSIDAANMTANVTYRNGAQALLTIAPAADRSNTTVTVNNITYDTVNRPFATLRSMWVENGNADCDTLEVQVVNYPILGPWQWLDGTSWFFKRTVPSQHNTWAPDIRIEKLAP